ncbi:MAG: carbohydrate kinase family protein [Nevskia sp.]
MSALICGSLAYDTIMVYSGQFKNDILPDKVHMLNVAFLVPELRREFGGTAGNIAYNLKMLGGEPLPMATVGKDFGSYSDRLDQLGISRQFVKPVLEAYTAQAYITTDLDDNQITAFHPGAMNFAHSQSVKDAVRAARVTLGSVSPDGRAAMVQHAADFADCGVPFIFDPGQGLPMFNGEELKDFIEKATYIAVNDYECEMLMSRTGWSVKDIAERVDALIVTRGGKGSTIYTQGKAHEIPNASAHSLADPTGCGDAYRGGLLYGLLNGMDWETTGRVASLLGAIKIERPGPQNHCVTPDEFHLRFAKEFRYDLK